MKQIKVSELSGAGLDYCVAVCESRRVVDDDGFLQWPEPFSSDWSQGGPIIDWEISKVFRNVGGTWSAMILRNDPIPYDERGTSLALTQRVQFNGAGNTPLIAAMRCYVASKLGDVVEIPEELC